LRVRGWKLSDWQSLTRAEKHDVLAADMRRQKDRNDDIEQRLGAWRKTRDMTGDGYVVGLLLEIWRSLA